MVELSGAYAAVKASVELAKSVKAIIDQIGDAEAKIQMANLLSALADVKIEAAESANKIVELERIVEAKELLSYDGQDGVYRDEEGNAWCQRCFDSEQKQIRLQTNGSTYEWHCRNCNSQFGKTRNRPRNNRVIR